MTEKPDHLLIQIGLRILRRRNALGMTQEDLGQKLGMARGNIADIEHGNRNLTIRSLCRLGEALDMTVVELVGGGPEAGEEADG